MVDKHREHCQLRPKVDFRLYASSLEQLLVYYRSAEAGQIRLQHRIHPRRRLFSCVECEEWSVPR